MEVGKRNRNGRIYPEELFKNSINEFITRKDKLGVAYGELGHPDTFDISLTNISHTIDDIKLKFAKVPRKKKKQMKKAGTYKRTQFVVSYTILDTNMGKVAKKIAKDLVPSPRGTGSLDENGVVQSDYKLLAIDLINSKDRA